MNAECHNLHRDLLPGDEGIEERDDSVGDKWRCLECGKNLVYAKGGMREENGAAEEK